MALELDDDSCGTALCVNVVVSGKRAESSSYLRFLLFLSLPSFLLL